MFINALKDFASGLGRGFSLYFSERQATTETVVARNAAAPVKRT